MTWQYLAGFTDGDGSIYCYENKGGRDVGVRWYQSGDEAWVLVEISDFLNSFGVETVLYEAMASETSLQKKPSFHLSVRFWRDSLVVINHLLPYLIVKKPNAEVALRYLADRVEKGKTCKKGHERTEINTFTRKDGKTECRVCRRETKAETRKQAREAG